MKAASQSTKVIDGRKLRLVYSDKPRESSIVLAASQISDLLYELLGMRETHPSKIALLERSLALSDAILEVLGSEDGKLSPDLEAFIDHGHPRSP